MSAIPDESTNSNSSSDGGQPLTPAVFHVLLALAREDMHGYGIMKTVETATDRKVKLGPGTLYGILKRLLESGWIVETPEQADPASTDERRRYYRLTGVGQRAASAEASRLAALVETARGRGLLPEAKEALNGGLPVSA